MLGFHLLQRIENSVQHRRLYSRSSHGIQAECTSSDSDILCLDRLKSVRHSNIDMDIFYSGDYTHLVEGTLAATGEREPGK